MIKVVFICGDTCSGKTFYAKAFYQNALKIEVSSIVKEISKGKDRNELTNTSHLVKDIATEIERRIWNSKGKDIVIVGIKQLTLYKELRLFCIQKSITYKNIWLSVPEHILRKRFQKRKRDIDKGYDFTQVRNLNQRLGFSEFVKYFLNENTQIIPNFSEDE